MTDVNIRGVSTFFLFAIPAVLALGALWWLAFGEGLHYFRRELSQEKRHAEAVGAGVLPKNPIEIKIIENRVASVRVDRAEIDGGDLWVYYKNFGQSRKEYIRYQWRLIAPDGTIVQSQEGYPSIYSKTSSPDSLMPGQRAEMRLKITADPRAVILEIEMQ